MVPLRMVVHEVLVYRALEMLLAEKYHPVGDFGFERQMKALQMGIAIGRSRRNPHRSNASFFEQTTKGRVKGGITIHDEEPLPLEESGEGIRKVGFVGFAETILSAFLVDRIVFGVFAGLFTFALVMVFVFMRERWLPQARAAGPA